MLKELLQFLFNLFKKKIEIVENTEFNKYYNIELKKYLEEEKPVYKFIYPYASAGIGVK